MPDRHDSASQAEGLAALAIGLSEMGEAEEAAKAQILAFAVRLTDRPSALLRAAAGEVQRLPQPIEESIYDTEAAEHIRSMLGVTSASDQLAAALRAREWLEQAADLIDDGSRS